jgi:hypothetical protein
VSSDVAVVGVWLPPASGDGTDEKDPRVRRRRPPSRAGHMGIEERGA